MQLLFFCLLVLGAGALSHPDPLTSGLAAPEFTSPITSTVLEKRGHKGWVGNFDNAQCSGTPIGNRPELDSKACIPFEKAGKYIGIFWGTWPFKLYSLGLYNGTCDLPEPVTYLTPEFVNPNDDYDDKIKENLCTPWEDWGQAILSVKVGPKFYNEKM